MSSPILILDLDNTIIGDITYPAILSHLYLQIKKQKIKIFNIDKKISKLYTEDSLVIRPFFTQFIKNLLDRIPSLLIFIYTASEKKWAHKEVSWIEKNCNLKFQRPIFTRDHCIKKGVTYVKSISKIFPIISQRFKDVSIDNIFIIDNNDVFTDCKHKFTICPHYNYIYFLEIWSYIPKELLKNTIIHSYLINFIKSNHVNPCSSHILSFKGREDLKSRYHEWLYKKYNEIHKNNIVYTKDIYWKLVYTLMKKNQVTNFHDNNFKTFKSKLQSISQSSFNSS
tara:strand:+ start:10843 stop:11688 length:846 start_codon:yes stop_codon:yes gene_type:complete